MVTILSPTRRERCNNPEFHCRNPRKSDRLLCSRCYMRKWRRNNPRQAAYATLRDHARARGIEFAITFQEFSACAWCAEYVERKGLAAESLTVDRKDNLRGYVPGNIQPMTRAANSLKKAKHDAHRMRAGLRWAASYVEEEAA